MGGLLTWIFHLLYIFSGPRHPDTPKMAPKDAKMTPKTLPRRLPDFQEAPNILRHTSAKVVVGQSNFQLFIRDRRSHTTEAKHVHQVQASISGIHTRPSPDGKCKCFGVRVANTKSNPGIQTW